MKIALIGQAAFGEAVFRALRDAGEQVVAVSSVAGTPERPDPLWAAAGEAGIARFPTGQLKKPDVLEAYAATAPDPALLPRHRGINAMHWAIRQGEPETGLSIFWVDAGIDTGPVLLRKTVAIGPDDTVG